MVNDLSAGTQKIKKSKKYNTPSDPKNRMEFERASREGNRDNTREQNK